jgi:hypothetical protein
MENMKFHDFRKICMKLFLNCWRGIFVFEIFKVNYFFGRTNYTILTKIITKCRLEMMRNKKL